MLTFLRRWTSRIESEGGSARLDLSYKKEYQQQASRSQHGMAWHGGTGTLALSWHWQEQQCVCACVQFLQKSEKERNGKDKNEAGSCRSVTSSGSIDSVPSATLLERLTGPGRVP
jgi:hypothetical protein